MSGLIEYSGHYCSQGKRIAFQVALAEPVPAGPDFVCKIDSQQLFTRQMSAYGVCPQQAIENALGVVNAALFSLVVPEGFDLAEIVRNEAEGKSD